MSSRLLVALGNMGPQYASTRHNVGHLLVDYIAAHQRLRFKSSVSCISDFAELTRFDQGKSSSLVLLKPHSFMNVIGLNVKKALRTFGAEQESLVVVHDDLEQKVGRFRIVQGTSFKGHNGLKSIHSSLGGFKDFTRIAIGIGRPEVRDPEVVANYVLSKFPSDELQVLKQLVFKKVLEDHVLKGDFTAFPSPNKSKKGK